MTAALRWASGDEPHPARFNAFMSGYNDSDPTIEKLYEQDFAKWIAELLSWFCFQTERSLGEWPETTEPERTVAAALAQDALATLQSSWPCFRIGRAYFEDASPIGCIVNELFSLNGDQG